MRFVNVQSSLHENVVFSVCAHLCNAAYVIFIMWNSISGLDAWYHFLFKISCGVAVMGRSHPKKILAPLPSKNYLKFLLMTSPHDSHTTAYVKLELIPGI